ncbi:hypothetical protein PG994_010915 [Apiospora phragmitis]|uniref:Carotenoid oxygenase n=1 Tax=Apiospora phragmitis TaxID=2905665 RepID=A0ABR1TRC4_9PEZI
MAHIHALEPQVANSHYVNGRLNSDTSKFPDTEVFRGMNKPSRFEGDIFDLEVTGEIPKEINGTFYRIQPDHRFPPIFEDDIHFNGDGSATAIRIENGHADFKQRYGKPQTLPPSPLTPFPVRTDRYNAETAARRSLFGRYRNPFTDNESVRGVIRTAANTNITFWRGVLLASKEDGPPFALDPTTLATLGRYDFEGQITAPTFTAHPKFDPDTGDMVCFAYEAGSNGADCAADVAVWTIGREDGKVQDEVWFRAPFAGMIHDCGVSANYVVLPLTPLKMSLERLKNGGNKFAWDPQEDQWYGLVPRRGAKAEDVKWFRADNGFHGHIAGCYENDEGKVVLDLTVADGNVFFFFPPEGTPDAGVQQRNRLSSPTCRWLLDPAAPAGARVAPALTWPTNGEFSRIDDRVVTKKYRHFWQARIDPARPYDFARCGPPAGGLFNCLGHYAWDAADEGAVGTEDVYFAGPTSTFQEPSFIPGTAGARARILIALLNHLDVLRNDVVIFDAQNLAAGPLATLRLPLKLKLGFHGNFVDHREIEAWYKRREEELGPVKVATEPLPWQQEMNSV